MIKYYSQSGEDFIAWHCFDFKKNGFFIEIGAFDGIHLSNTYSFEKAGWKGICVEPHPDYYPLCKRNRPNSICLQLACVDKESLHQVEFYAEELGLLSGINIDEDDIKERYKRRGLKYTSPVKILINANTLNRILEENLPSNTEIDLLSIDVEGTEINVLNGFNLDCYNPKIVIIEANEKEMEDKIHLYFKQYHQYHYVKKIGANLIYVNSQDKLNYLKKLNINCNFEYQVHPKGEKYTIQSNNYSPQNKAIEFSKRVIQKIKSCRRRFLNNKMERERIQ